MRGISWRKALKWGGLGVIAFFLLIQAIPYGRAHHNPPVLQEPAWSSPQTRALAARACFDCHSNQTTWPFYSNIAPVSWLVQRDVDSGRSAFNFSEWNRTQDTSIGDVVDAIRGGSMPPWFYPILHPNASLSSQEKAELIAGLEATLRASPPKGGGG